LYAIYTISVLNSQASDSEGTFPVTVFASSWFSQGYRQIPTPRTGSIQLAFTNDFTELVPHGFTEVSSFSCRALTRWLSFSVI